MQKVDQIIRTKLHLPFTRQGLVPRPLLQDQIKKGLCEPLTVITAPAGFGKTTLVASCVASCGMPVAWLSLDKNDNRAGRFLNYLVAVLQEACQTIGSEAAQLLSASQDVSSEAVLTSLINDLDASGDELVLVLDDYQVINSQAVHDIVTFLLEHHPNTFHLVIVTRSDPPLPFARLRARGQVVELRATNLRFTEAEAAQFLNDVMGLRLDARSVSVLEERTEGWVAGLQMAALSMRDRKDLLGFIEGFSGTNRYILDYLLEEVLERQSAEVQRFLLCTSILEHLTAPLCEAVMASAVLPNNEGSEREGNDPVACSSAIILDYLDRADLFLIPLDTERLWYRYHHLFQDLLLQRLKSVEPLEEIARFHRRAAAWLEANDFISESIQHSLYAGDYQKAADIVEQNALRLFAQGKLHQLLSWTDTLPEAIVEQRPRLSIYQAYILGFAGKLGEARRMVNIAKQSLQTNPLPAEALHGLELELAGVQGLIAISLGDAPAALALTELVKGQDDSNHLFAFSLIHWSVGFAYRMQGDLRRAIPKFERALQIGEQLENSLTVLSGSHELGMALRLSGKLREAEAVFRRGLQLIDRFGSSRSGFVGRQESALSIALYERNALEEAYQLARNAVEHNRTWDTQNHTVNGFRALAQVLIARGNLPEADQALHQAETILSRTPVIPIIIANVEALRVRWWSACGDFEKLDAWLESHLSNAKTVEKPGEEAEIGAITVSHIWVNRRNRAAAWGLLHSLEPDARKMGRINSLIQILVLKSLSAPNPSMAMENLEETLRYAHLEGYRRVFLDEGQPMQVLLAQWLAHARTGPLRDYVIDLLSQFPAEETGVEKRPVIAAKGDKSPAGSLVEPGVQSANNMLVEPLSQRELEVLHLMALGRTNQVIARDLIVALGTIKAHAVSIYRKLDVANRTEAVARARQLGILP
jgi:LuxR family maltose regulon positive regulatory protein